jgi:hypothetical protein
MKDLVRSILNILGHAGRIISLVRNTILNTFLLLIVIAAIAGYFFSSPPKIPANSILKLTLKGDVVE